MLEGGLDGGSQYPIAEIKDTGIVLAFWNSDIEESFQLFRIVTI